MSEAGNITLLQIAQVLKSNGTDGELVMSFRDIEPDEIDIKEPVYIYFDGLPVPFFIESLTRRGTNKALVHLTGIHNLTDAEEITGRAVYADEDLFEEEEGDGLDLDNLIGWTLVDEESKTLGRICDFEDIPGNPCIYVETDNAQAMVPLHEDLILDIDYDSCILRMRIPEGLV